MVTTELQTRGKIPYIVSKTERFVISKDPFSQTRFDALISFQAALHKYLGVDVALSAHGSLTKGATITHETADQRDVDVFVFLKQSQMRARELPSWRQGDPFTDIEIAEKFLINYMKERALTMGFSENPLLHYVIRPIDYHGENSIQAALNTLKLDEEDKNARERLASFFHMDVGGGLLPYQQAFLRGYLGHEDQGENDWALVASSVAQTERNGVIPQSLQEQYPENFQEALQYYDVAIAKSR